MSRSFRRRPFLAITGDRSAKQDKQIAARGLRRAHNQAIHNCTDFEELLLPHRRECHWNNVYSWSRDGKQRYQAPRAMDWHDHVQALAYFEAGHRDSWTLREMIWPPVWFRELFRK